MFINYFLFSESRAKLILISLSIKGMRAMLDSSPSLSQKKTPRD